MANNSLLFSTNKIGQRNLTFPNQDCGNLYKPICLQLKGNKTIQIKSKSKSKQDQSEESEETKLKSKQGDEIQAYTDVDKVKRINASAPQGLLSVFKAKEILKANEIPQANEIQQANEKKYKKITKIAICVTIFKEKLPDLENTLKGISQNFQDFLQMGIQPHEIAVFVIFDGISHVFNDQKEFSSYHNNIISFFNQVIDKSFNIKGEETLQAKYDEYKKFEDHFNEFSPQKREKIKQNKQLLVKLSKKYQEDIINIEIENQLKDKQLNLYEAMVKLYEKEEDKKFEGDKQLLIKFIRKNQKQTNIETENLLLKDSKVYEAMKNLYEKAKKKLEKRKNQAWVYQIEEKHPLFFVFKYANGRKLSSHNWFFGFCEELQPEYVILLDVGCVPEKKSLALLIKELKNPNQNIGGVCGTMRIKLEKEQYSYDINLISHLMAKIFSIQRCQQCEYDLGHILDKQYESSLNYVHVLPGAFSAYQYKALKKNDENQKDPLDIYLKSQREGGEKFQDIQEANMYLAEDRVLCAQLYFNGYKLRYVPESYAEVDPMLNLIDLMFQRRRWINGSWFALNKVVQDFKDQQQKNNTINRMDQFLFALSLIFAQIGQITQYFYQTFQIVWIYMIMKTIVLTGQMWSDFLVISLVIGIYLILILSLILLSLAYDPVSIDIISKMQKKSDQGQTAQELKNWYFDKFYLISTILGIFNYVVIVYTIYLLINDIILGDKQFSFIYNSSLPQNYYILLIIISFGTNALPFIIGIFLNSKMIFSILRNLPAYLFYQPTYNNVFVIYSFCRIDDLSWGTKGLHMDSQSNITIDKQYSKFIFILQWLLLNIIMSTIIFLILNLSFYLLFQSIVLGIGVLLTLLSIIKGIFAFQFQLRNRFFLRNQRKNQKKTENSQIDDRFYKNIIESLQSNVQN